jgi:polar amino acid transport system substrate-binding protein
MIIASMTMVPERNLKVAYIGPYFISGQSIIFTRETALSVRKLKDINNAGFSVAVPAGTTSEMTAKMALPKTNLTSTKSMDDAIKLLLDGKVKAVIADAPTAAVVTYRYTEKGLISTEPLTFEPIGIAVSGNDPLLMNWLQNYIMILKGEGDLDFLVEKWFKDVSWVKDLQ